MSYSQTILNIHMRHVEVNNAAKIIIITRMHIKIFS